MNQFLPLGLDKWLHFWPQSIAKSKPMYTFMTSSVFMQQVWFVPFYFQRHFSLVFCS